MNWFARTLQIYEQRNTRERLLITITLMAAIWGVWLFSVGGFVIDHTIEMETKIDQLAKQLRSETQTQKAKLLDVPRRLALQSEREQLQKVVNNQARELDLLLQGFVAPGQVPELLEELVKKHKGIALLSFTNGEPKEVEIGGVSSGLFSHPVKIELAGGYADVVAYLEDLEQIPHGLNWHALHYEVEEYPRARVRIEIESLSKHRAWLGV